MVKVGQKRQIADIHQTKAGNKRKRTTQEEESEYLPTDIETQLNHVDFVAKPNNKRQKIADTNDNKSQSSIADWIYNFGTNIFNRALGNNAKEINSQISNASKKAKGKRSCKKKQAAPMLEKTYSNENRLTLMPEISSDQKLLSDSKNQLKL